MVDRERYVERLSEGVIERRVCDHAFTIGLLQYKFVSPNLRGVPDRIFLYEGHALFIEFKAEGDTRGLRPLQQKQRDKLVEHGCPVFVVSSVKAGKNILDSFKQNVDTELDDYRRYVE